MRIERTIVAWLLAWAGLFGLHTFIKPLDLGEIVRVEGVVRVP